MAITAPRATLKRGELARRAGCNSETIRYYEKIGLLGIPERSEGGHRLYAPDDQARLGFILRGRELGFSIEELRGLLGLADARDTTCGEVLALTRRHIDGIRAKIADLKRLEVTLVAVSAECEGGNVPDCPILDALFQTADV
ncbi:MerR family transcriptional regulator [Aurantimonas marianensis]|uniref:Helix-turn-helix domain-containing protein n=1 Tax=Aurantimonas marianensis TaxID=2920428 RepID=A0A9X2H7D2_9HYPH|nr:helix-turn-helix domain-containing protein [Aurantimonas marianensis]MCP3056737.1 helix-turn-helix domain-containing protein [Aurantimonas marianensis]